MGLLDVLRGQPEPKRPDLDRLFALTTAELTLRINLGLEPLPVSGVCFRPVEMANFDRTLREIDHLLDGDDSGSSIRHSEDEHGFGWILIDGGDFGTRVTATHHVNQTLHDSGFGAQLLCSVFPFSNAEGDLSQLVYGYTRGTFYPFVPVGEHARDNSAELRLAESLKGELPMEPELERWYALWGNPVAPPHRR